MNTHINVCIQFYFFFNFEEKCINPHVPTIFFKNKWPSVQKKQKSLCINLF